MDFQEQVKFVRMHLQLSQEEFARQMGIYFATVCSGNEKAESHSLLCSVSFIPFAGGTELKQTYLTKRICDGGI